MLLDVPELWQISSVLSFVGEGLVNTALSSSLRDLSFVNPTGGADAFTSRRRQLLGRQLYEAAKTSFSGDEDIFE